MTLTPKDISIKNGECLILRQPREYALCKSCDKTRINEIVESCIFDEIKPLFGIPKTGREYVFLRQRIIFLQKVSYDPAQKEWLSDKKLTTEEQYTIEVLKILLFRRFYGLPYSMFVIRSRINSDSGEKYYITWGKDHYSKEGPVEYDIPFRFFVQIIKKYHTVNDFMKEMVQITNIQDIDNLVKKIKKIVKKYDEQYLFLVSYTRNKLLELIT